jgi:hypothetical protein
LLLDVEVHFDALPNTSRGALRILEHLPSFGNVRFEDGDVRPNAGLLGRISRATHVALRLRQAVLQRLQTPCR